MLNHVNDELLNRAKKEGIAFLQLEFVDLHGTPKMMAIPIHHLEQALENGIGIDGSSVTGFVTISDSDLVAKPDPKTWSTIPEVGVWRHGGRKVARMICDIKKPGGKAFEGDPRYILKRILKKLADDGMTFYVGPELEFYLVNYDPKGVIRPIDSGGYFDVFPSDMGGDIRWEVISVLEEFGLEVELGHHEAGPGQHEIDFQYAEALEVADKCLIYKQVTKAIASSRGVLATFMPKPIQKIAGSGMHLHQSIFQTETGENLFFDKNKNPTYLSDFASFYVGGLMEHAKALSMIVAPTINSYRRLVPGYEAPVYITWGFANRSCLIRIPNYHPGMEKAMRAEFRCPDVSCNPYLAITAVLAAGLDGVEKEIDPGEAIAEDVYKFDSRDLERRNIETLPSSLFEALEALKKDDVLKNALGDHLFSRFVTIKTKEWEEFQAFLMEHPEQGERISDWEIQRYLTTA